MPIPRLLAGLLLAGLAAGCRPHAVRGAAPAVAVDDDEVDEIVEGLLGEEDTDLTDEEIDEILDDMMQER